MDTIEVLLEDRESKDQVYFDQLPQGIKEKYIAKKLNVEDILEHIELFRHMDYFVGHIEDTSIRAFFEQIHLKNVKELFLNHSDFISNLDQFAMDKLSFRYTQSNITCFLDVRDNIKGYLATEVKDVNEQERLISKIPSLGFKSPMKVVDAYNTVGAIKEYDSANTFIKDDFQRRIFNLFGKDNIIKFDEETNYFTKNAISHYNPLKRAFKDFYLLVAATLNEENDVFYNHHFENLSYKEFRTFVADIFNKARKKHYYQYQSFDGYSFIEGQFREDFSDIFVPKSTSTAIQNLFYQHKLSIKDFKKFHLSTIEDIDTRDLHNLFYDDFRCGYIEGTKSGTFDLMDFYVNNYGRDAFFSFFTTYGNFFEPNIVLERTTNKEQFDRNFRDQIYETLLVEKHDYSSLKNDVFALEHPELFVDENLIHEKLVNKIYSMELTFDDVLRHPELVTALKGKNLNVVFRVYDTDIMNTFLYYQLKKYNEDFLKLCSEYGEFISFHFDTYLPEGYIREALNINIKESLLLGKVKYNYDTFNGFNKMPSFLKEKYKELFLDPEAPYLLQEAFYDRSLTFSTLHYNPTWIPFLKGKSTASGMMGKYPSHKQAVKKYFSYFGEEKGLELGVKNYRVVEHMIEQPDKVNQLISWYEKLDKKFIPDFVVMENMPLDEADKFLASGRWWSKLMNISSFKGSSESREAILKLAYSFGVFDNDQKGYKSLIDLLTNVPKTIGEREYWHLSEGEYFAPSSALQNFEWEMVKQQEEALKNQKIIAQNEGIEVDFEKPLIVSLYKEITEGTYQLQYDLSKCPKTLAYIREKMEINGGNVISPMKAHQLFGGFKMEYNKAFREFLLTNMDYILKYPEYTKFVSSIQKQFNEIKAINSNRSLTFERALNYVQSAHYYNINIGNEKAAEISSIAGYSEDDFEVLQQIYNYGKQRVFSSIPRIENQTEEYTYEILRLDDPLAMAIGTLTDCCQEIGDAAEVDMEHSMVDKNGRVFVIYDNEKNVVSQSWMWRNQDTICFDNIEIPHKAFKRAKQNQKTDTSFAEEIYEIYKKASREMLAIDKKMYDTLLKANQITEEEYNHLLLKKVTVGLGYNDIAAAIRENAEKDKETKQPLYFVPPIPLAHSLYINDSRNQYILEKEGAKDDHRGLSTSDVSYEEFYETKALYNDTYIEYTDSNFTQNDFCLLEKLAMVTRGESLDIDIDNPEEGRIVSKIAQSYDLDSSLTKIILHPNFALIYEDNEDHLKIADLFYNLHIDNQSQQMDITDKVMLQIRLAVDQIKKNKEIDISSLDEIQLSVYKSAMDLDQEINKERGIKK